MCKLLDLSSLDFLFSAMELKMITFIIWLCYYLGLQLCFEKWMWKSVCGENTRALFTSAEVTHISHPLPRARELGNMVQRCAKEGENTIVNPDEKQGNPAVSFIEFYQDN